MAYQKTKKPGHLVNLAELVGPETYDLLCMAITEPLPVVIHVNSLNNINCVAYVHVY